MWKYGATRKMKRAIIEEELLNFIERHPEVKMQGCDCIDGDKEIQRDAIIVLKSVIDILLEDP